MTFSFCDVSFRSYYDRVKSLFGGGYSGHHDGRGTHRWKLGGLAAGIRIMKTKMPDRLDGSVTDVSDWVFCQVLRREAEGIIGRGGPSTMPAAVTRPQPTP